MSLFFIFFSLLPFSSPLFLAPRSGPLIIEGFGGALYDDNGNDDADDDCDYDKQSRLTHSQV